MLLRVGSANYLSVVYVNGVKVGAHEGGHLPFAFEIGELVRWGEENVIAVSVENQLKPTRVPAGNMPSRLDAFDSFPRTTFDFFPFAGIHRPVVLYTTPQSYIEDITVVTDIEGADGRVRVQVKVNGAAASGRASLRGGEQAVTAELKFEGGAAEATLAVPGACLWSDTDPYLDDLAVSTESDSYTLNAGIRTVAVEGGKVVLNGKPVQMNGSGRHEDFIASGRGLNLPLLVKDYQLMR